MDHLASKNVDSPLWPASSEQVDVQRVVKQKAPQFQKLLAALRTTPLQASLVPSDTDNTLDWDNSFSKKGARN